MKLFIKPTKIGRTKKICFYVLKCPQFSDKNHNMAIKVYTLQKNMRLTIIGADYAINTAFWKGVEGAGIDILTKLYTDMAHNGYLITDSRVIVYQMLN